jgi:chloramphenicol O-acetyltransferase
MSPRHPVRIGVSIKLNQKLPVTPKKYTPKKAPTIKKAPWAKFTTLSMPKMRHKPSARSA